MQDIDHFCIRFENKTKPNRMNRMHAMPTIGLVSLRALYLTISKCTWRRCVWAFQFYDKTFIIFDQFKENTPTINTHAYAWLQAAQASVVVINFVDHNISALVGCLHHSTVVVVVVVVVCVYGFLSRFACLGTRKDVTEQASEQARAREQERELFFHLVCMFKHCPSGIYTCIVGKIQSTQNGLKSPFIAMTKKNNEHTMRHHMCYFFQWNSIAITRKQPHEILFAILLQTPMNVGYFRSYLAKCLSRCHMMSLDKNGKRSPFNVPFVPSRTILFAFICIHYGPRKEPFKNYSHK